ncbi:vegetative incompatibility protein HET-E-1 [Penicillium malachiteum]|uniref:vegetative incompatibility protein HET-E-1 n=1 Tax=Penicillium malachiteum TaxID=1324776 RepID=UPI002546B8C6|nr:vegetative incompatibility protein HET-E-1 [Penicillium malachiteum]KAJ5730165.1 vegetative incompatibility protein HET-E-1 [Penicillium malachiteum]
MNEFVLWAALVVLPAVLLYPVFGKIRRRGKTDRPDGLYTVYEPEQAEDVTFEIVAVHGLGAHPEYTWTGTPSVSTSSGHRNRIHLLRDLLKNDFPTARILAFAHNSDWLIDAPITSAQQIGNRLLDELVKHRLKYRSVPIVFLGHSFGGIVIKEALCKPEETARDIVDSTCGIIFLGTPHQGSPISILGTVAARVTGFLGSNTGLLLSLAGNRTQLSDLDVRFVQCMKDKEVRRQKTEIVAFCEGKPTRMLGWLSVGLIVPIDSARGGHAAQAVFIDTDHSGLNKCKRRDDLLYQSLWEQLRRLRPTTTPTLNGNQQYVVDKLRTVEGAAFNSHANEHVATCLGNTRHELLDTINQWTDGPIAREHIYWLQGKAGTGKSTIARTVAGELAEQGRLAASFFFKKTEIDRKSADYLFTTIAAQLVRGLPAVAEHMRNAIEDNPHIATMALGEQFRKLIVQPIKAILYDFSKTMTVVIDALDECEGDEDITTIIKLLLQTDRSEVVPLKFFVTSRFEPPIRLGFQGVQDRFIEFPVHEIPQPMIERDITTFLRFRLDEMRSRFGLPAGWPGSADFNRLLKRSIPLFIFAATTCRFIEDHRQAGEPNDRLQKILQQKASGAFDAIYLPILSQMVDGLKGSARRSTVTEFKEIVGSIVTLVNPLSAASLACLLGISTECVNNRLQLLHSVLDIPSDPGHPLRIFHESFRDFIVHPDPEDVHEFYVDERSTHKMLADRCLTLLSHGGYLKQDICGLGAPGTSRADIDQQTIDRCLPPEAQYACIYWVHHLKKSRVKLDDEYQVLSFLLDHFLHWLEALSLMGMISEGIRLLDDLLGLVDHKFHSQVHEFLQDVKRFTLQNSYIAGIAPLQLYYSGLAFAPVQSVIRKIFVREKPKQIETLPVAMEYWNSNLQTLEGDSDRVRSVAFSPDGQTVASGSYNHTIKLWDARTGKELQTLRGHSGSIWSVAFSPDGQTVASSSDDHTIKLWDAHTGKELQTLKGHSGRVKSVAFSPDGQTVASGSDDHTIKIWDAQICKLLQTLQGHFSSVRSVTFSPDGQILASGSDDCTIKLWDAQMGKDLQTLDGYYDSVNSVTFSPDGHMVASGSADDRIQIWDVQTGKESQTLQTLEGYCNSVNSVAFSPDGQIVASGSDDCTIKLWDAQMGQLLQTFQGHSDSVWSIAFSPDGQMVASGSNDCTIKLWDAQMDKKLQTSKGHSSYIPSMAFSPDGQTVASGSNDCTIKLWDTQTGKPLQTLKGHSSSVQSVAFSPDGQTVASGSADHMIKLWGTQTGKELQTLKGHSGRVKSVAFSPDGQTVASSSDDHTIKLWDAQICKLLQTLQGHFSSVRSVTFSPDGQILASGSDDCTIKLWDAHTGKELQTLKGHFSIVWSVAFSPDSQMVASGSDDKTTKLWDTHTGKELQTLKGHSSWVETVAFSPDGQIVASVCRDCTIKLWDAHTGKELQTFQGHPDSVTSIVSQIPNQPHVSVPDDWVAFGNHNLIWLPAEYRIFYYAAIRHDRLALGYSTGTVLIIGFRSH